LWITVGIQATETGNQHFIIIGTGLGSESGYGIIYSFIWEEGGLDWDGTGVKSVSARTQRVVSLLVVWWGEGREGGSGVDGGQKGDGDGDRGEGFRFF